MMVSMCLVMEKLRDNVTFKAVMCCTLLIPLTDEVNQHKCTKHLFIHSLMAVLKNSHIENSKNHKR